MPASMGHDQDKECLVSTVYDETREKQHERHAMMFLLHLASWKKNVSSRYPLRVVCITEPKQAIRDAIESFGASIEVHPSRHYLFDRGACYNKHLAAPANTSRERVFLTDNDTVYMGPIDALFEARPSAVLVSLAPKARIAPEMWDVLIQDFGARPIEYKWRPPGAHALDLRDGTRDCAEQQYAYFNGGAIVFPEGRDFWNRWEEKSVALSDFLVAHGYNGQKTVGTDQASLCLTVAAHGDWELMPKGFNFFSFHYWLGEIPLQDVRHVHLAGIGRQWGLLDADEKRLASPLVMRFWDNAILSGMRELGRDDEEIAGAIEHRDFILALIKEHDLEELERHALHGKMITKPARKGPPKRGFIKVD